MWVIGLIGLGIGLGGALWLFSGRPPEGTVAVAGCEAGGKSALDLTGGRWCYDVVGSGEEHLVVLVGGLGLPAAVPAPLREPGEGIRVWAVAHPPMVSVDDVVLGLTELMDAVGISEAHFLGASVGGALVQAVAREAPGRVKTLVLSNTAAPLGSALPARVWVALRRPLARLPDAYVERTTRRRLVDAVEAGAGVDPEWRASVQGLSAAHVFALADLLVDFHRREYTPTDLDGWPGGVLIIESEDDPMVPSRHRKRLRQLYPGAEVHTFSNGGHTPSVRRPGAYREIVLGFLAVERAGGPEAEGTRILRNRVAK